MDFSIKNIQNKQPAFKGVKGDFDLKNNQIIRFFLPSHQKSEVPYLELTLLDKEVNSAGSVTSGNYIPKKVFKIAFDRNTTLELPREIFEKQSAGGFAYRYIFENTKTGHVRYALDPTKKAKLEGVEKNLVELGKNFGVTPISGAMHHSFIDSEGINIETLSEKDKNFIRNHFNKLGGSIKGLNYLLKKGYFDSVKYVMSTPDIGADSVSSHGYWPVNQYQSSSLEDFKEFNFELFKRGKGYVADGAFTSQGIQSPLS